MKLRLAFGAFALTLAACSTTGDPGPKPLDASVKQEVASQLEKTFHNFTYDDIKASELPDVYEVYTAGRIVYFAPKQNMILFGEMYSTDGKSVTAQKLAALQQEKAATIDKSVAVVIGDGPIEVMEFVNPDCGYCRISHQWLQQQGLLGKVKELVFFMNLSNDAATQRAASVICTPPDLRRTAYEDLWSGKPFDASKAITCDGVANRLAAQAKEATRLGVVGTPTWVINGEVVTGFRQDQLSSLLASN